MEIRSPCNRQVMKLFRIAQEDGEDLLGDSLREFMDESDPSPILSNPFDNKNPAGEIVINRKDLVGVIGYVVKSYPVSLIRYSTDHLAKGSRDWESTIMEIGFDGPPSASELRTLSKVMKSFPEVLKIEVISLKKILIKFIDRWSVY